MIDGQACVADVKSKYDYFLCRHGYDPIRIDIFDYHDPYDDVYLTHWIRVLRKIEAISSVPGLIFYIVWDTEAVRRLPSYGENVVVLLLMDEFCEIPPYFGRVRFVFKTHGFFPYVNRSLLGKSSAFLAKAVRDAGRWMYFSGRPAIRHGAAISREDGGMVVPLGYARQTDLPGRPFAERRYAVSFVGSVRQRPYHPLSIRALLGTPKDIARSRMLDGLRQLAATTPETVFFADTGSYLDGVRSDGIRYSELMADTQICLAPRGSSTETFRLFEGMRQGCVVICDRVPRHWFFDDCPFIQLDDWADLSARVTELLADPQHLFQLHEKALAWWDRRCSAQSLATVMARRLDGAPGGNGFEGPHRVGVGAAA